MSDNGEDQDPFVDATYGERDDTSGTVRRSIAEALPPDLPVSVLMTMVKRDIGAIAKGRQTDSGASYSFRGIDDVYDAMHEPLAKWGVLPIPRIAEIVYNTHEWMDNGRRRAQTVTRLHLEVAFMGPRGDSVMASAWAEAQDYGDKAVAKAESVAFRTVMIQTFTIPVHDPVTSVEIEQENVEREAGGGQVAPSALNALRKRLRSVGDAWSTVQRGAFVSAALDRPISGLGELSLDDVNQVLQTLNLHAAGDLPVRFEGTGDDCRAVLGEETPAPDEAPAEAEADDGSGEAKEPAAGPDESVPEPEAQPEDPGPAERARTDVARQADEQREKVEQARQIEALLEQIRVDVASLDKKALVEELTRAGSSTSGTVAALRARVVDLRAEAVGV